jgi:hypothetical protein
LSFVYLQHLVDVRRIGLDTLLVLLAGSGSLLGGGSLLGRLLGWSLGHVGNDKND